MKRITSAALRREQRAYVADLRSRVRLVACPVCRAKVGQACVGSRGTPVTWCHNRRSDVAKSAGHVKGQRRNARATLLATTERTTP